MCSSTLWVGESDVNPNKIDKSDSQFKVSAFQRNPTGFYSQPPVTVTAVAESMFTKKFSRKDATFRENYVLSLLVKCSTKLYEFGGYPYSFRNGKVILHFPHITFMLPSDFSSKIHSGNSEFNFFVLEMVLNGKLYISEVDNSFSPTGASVFRVLNPLLREIFLVAIEYRQRATYNRTFIAPQDFDWLVIQGEAVRQLWIECHQALGNSTQWQPLSTTLKRTAFKDSRRSLTTAGLFSFKPKQSAEDARKHDGWLVRHHCCERLEKVLQEVKTIEDARASPN